jgi:tryptophan synthase alpha subunit
MQASTTAGVKAAPYLALHLGQPYLNLSSELKLRGSGSVGARLLELGIGISDPLFDPVLAFAVH